MTHEKPELLTDTRVFTTLFYVIFTRKTSEWSEWSNGSNLGMRFVIWCPDLGIRHFALFKHCFLSTNRLLKGISHVIIFVIREKRNFYIHDP